MNIRSSMPTDENGNPKKNKPMGKESRRIRRDDLVGKETGERDTRGTVAGRILK
jgi:hypothetical protein